MMLGLVTLVIKRVDSVTSTCLRSSFGDMTTFSGPIVPGSSGTLPGHSSTMRGLSPAVPGAAMEKQTSRQTVNAMRFMTTPSGDATCWMEDILIVRLREIFALELKKIDAPVQCHAIIGRGLLASPKGPPWRSAC